MSEITTISSEQKAGVKRSKKLSTRVDLTPMVGLGFLLITFFIFTTTLSLPKSMKIVMPAGDPDMPIGNSSALTIIPLADNKIFYYHGELTEALSNKLYGTSSYSFADGIGSVIREKQSALDRSGIGRNELMLIIKPAESSRFANTVDILDEVLINEVRRYALTEQTNEEKQILASLKIQL